MEYAPWLSKLLFYWVNPLMQKGVDYKLKHPDDLYDLPDSLNSTTISRRFNKALNGSEFYKRPTDTEVAFRPEQKQNISLLRALHKCFWFNFYSIGALKFIGDVSGFAGPMLLNKLVGFIEDKSENIQLGYLYAFGLFSTTLISAFCTSHFNFYMSIVGLKIRTALVTTIYRKTLSVGGTVLSSCFSVGEIVNFMSTDTDRIVNSCPSFHALWSIPFQV